MADNPTQGSQRAVRLVLRAVVLIAVCAFAAFPHVPAVRICVAAVCATLGLWAVAYALLTVRRGLRTGPWLAVPGRIVEGRTQAGPRVRSLWISRQRSYNLAIVYSYEVAGRTWQGARIKFGESGAGSYGDVQLVQERYGPGTRVTVYYDPEDPSQAVLERGVSANVWFGLAVGTALLAATMILISPVLPR